METLDIIELIFGMVYMLSPVILLGILTCGIILAIMKK